MNNRNPKKRTLSNKYFYFTFEDGSYMTRGSWMIRTPDPKEYFATKPGDGTLFPVKKIQVPEDWKVIEKTRSCLSAFINDSIVEIDIFSRNAIQKKILTFKNGAPIPSTVKLAYDKGVYAEFPDGTKIEVVNANQRNKKPKQEKIKPVASLPSTSEPVNSNQTMFDLDMNSALTLPPVFLQFLGEKNFSLEVDNQEINILKNTKK